VVLHIATLKGQILRSHTIELVQFVFITVRAKLGKFRRAWVEPSSQLAIKPDCELVT